MATPQIIPHSGVHTQVISSAGAPNGATPVYIVYKPAGNESARRSPTAMESTAAQSVLQTGMNGATLIQTSAGHPIINGATIIQAQPLASKDLKTIRSDIGSQRNIGATTIVQSPKLNGTTIPNATIIQAANHPFINSVNGTAVIQANGQQLQIVQPQSLVSGPSIMQTISSPTRVVTTVSNSRNVDFAKARPSIAPTIDIRSLTGEKSIAKPPPALVQVKLAEKEDSVNERVTISPPSVVQIPNGLSKVNGHNVIFQSPMPHGGNSVQKVYIVAENAVDSSPAIVLPAPNATDTSHLRAHTVIPIGYEQQVSPMPIYRFNTLNCNTMQPIQILRTFPAGLNPATMTTA